MKTHELFKPEMNHIETSCLTETKVYVYYNLIIVVVL